MQQTTIWLRIARVESSIEFLHRRLQRLSPFQTADAMYARTRLGVLKRSLKVLRAHRERVDEKEVQEERPLRKQRVSAVGHEHRERQQDGLPILGAGNQESGYRRENRPDERYELG